MKLVKFKYRRSCDYVRTNASEEVMLSALAAAGRNKLDLFYIKDIKGGTYVCNLDRVLAIDIQEAS